MGQDSTGNCKCGARSYDGHLKKVAEGFPGHVFKGTTGVFGQR